jgi:hypothetical protein
VKQSEGLPVGTYWYILNYTSVESGQTVTIKKTDTCILVDNKKKKILSLIWGSTKIK